MKQGVSTQVNVKVKCGERWSKQVNAKVKCGEWLPKIQGPHSSAKNSIHEKELIQLFFFWLRGPCSKKTGMDDPRPLPNRKKSRITILSFQAHGNEYSMTLVLSDHLEAFSIAFQH